MLTRQKVAMLVAEVFGTTTLAVAVYSMVARTSFPLFGGMAAGLTLALMVLAVGKVSGALINPAVTVGLWSIRKLKTTSAIMLLAAQMLGGVAAWSLIKYFIGRPLDSLVQGPFDWKVLIAEAVGAIVFTFGLASAVYQKYEGGKLAFAAGASLTLGILVASMASNGVINPAVAVGLQSWSWAYAVGPLIGSVIGMNLYALLFEADLPKIRVVRVNAKPAVKATKAKAAKTVTKKTAKKRK